MKNRSFKIKPKHLIVFARYPEAGKVKTRLTSHCSQQEAASFHQQMAELTFLWARKLRHQRAVSIQGCITGNTSAAFRQWLGKDLLFEHQRDGDLGKRVNHAMQAAFRRGARKVMVVGTDCPSLRSALVQDAFDKLHTDEVVLGPAEDGGYYLIGLRKPCPSLFKGIEWGTRNVLEQTLQKIQSLNMKCGLLHTLKDVDRHEDLKHFQKVQQQVLPKISVIIPTLNESQFLPATLESVMAGTHIETIVSDGGSTDETLEIARSMNAKVIHAPKGRWVQMNEGAKKAKGELLLFLHADTLLPKHYDYHIRTSMLNTKLLAGAFRFQVLEPSWLLSFVTKCVEWRCKLLKLPYGDQALFLRAKGFDAYGPFPKLPIMEDVAFVRKLNQHGKIGLLSQTIQTSGRRWRKHGVIKTSFMNQVCLWAYLLGVSPHRIHKWYYPSS